MQKQFNNKKSDVTGALVFLVCIVLAIGCQPDSNSEIKKQHKTWTDYGGGPDQSKFFVQDQITKENVTQLEVAFTYSTGDDRSYQNNPLVVDTIMYIMAKDNSMVAIHATTGEEIWIHAKLNGITRRGFSYWENEDRTDRRIIFTLNNSLQAIDAMTGKSILTFGNEGVVDLRQGLSKDPNQISRIASRTPGRIFEDLILIGSSPGEGYLSSPGHVRAYNVVTGEMAWVFHTIPQPGEYGYETWPEEAYRYVGGVNCWGEISVDEDRGIAFFPIGSPTYDYYGADRHGANLFGNCLLALDARTGERLWHFQTVHHDMWDYDLVSAPQLITVDHEGERLDAVALATKQGFMFAFNRETGESLWPIEERPVPPSTIPGEEAWPTQPFPTQLPPFTRQTVNVEDISPLFLSDEEYEDWKERIRKAKKGLYTPLDTIETIAMPGAVGGANWGNTASNPDKGLVYVLSQAYPSFYKLAQRPPQLPAAFRRRIESQQSIARGAEAFERHCEICHGKDLAGTALGPSLLSIADRLNIQFLQQAVRYGMGRMPAVQHISDEEIGDILALLKDRSTGSSEGQTEEEDLPEGPVVASGGAPGEAELRGNFVYNPGGGEYPEGVEAPDRRYYTGYGLGFAYILNPPWTSVTAYDMNKGTIKWTRPLGEEPQALAMGEEHTGVPTGSQRQGMIVTSNGLIFSTVTNGAIYAYDADNGDILWKGQTELGIATMPTMYEVDGKIYLVVNATTPQVKGWNLANQEGSEPPQSENTRGEYVVFSLPAD